MPEVRQDMPLAAAYTCKKRVSARSPSGLAPQQYVVSTRNQHDDGRVHAREERRLPSLIASAPSHASTPSGMRKEAICACTPWQLLYLQDIVSCMLVSTWLMTDSAAAQRLV